MLKSILRKLLPSVKFYCKHNYTTLHGNDNNPFNEQYICEHCGKEATRFEKFLNNDNK